MDPDMPTFLQSQSDLAKARAALANARSAAAQAGEAKKKAQAQMDQLSRTADARDGAAKERQTKAGMQLKQIASDLQAKQEALSAAKRAADQALIAFEPFSDPRKNVSSFPDSLPFLLMPVRMETRFVKIGEVSQLWVRIYPDDCSIDTFEDTLSASELANAKLFWQGIWRAGGIEADERAAWRSLVGAHGSGRASWIVDHYLPTNLPAPKKVAATDEILVIPTLTPLAGAEAAAISDYWQKIWLADGDRGKSDAALAALKAAVGASGAAQLVADYAPYNLTDKPIAQKKRSDVALSTAFVVFPPDPATRQSSWSQAPVVNHLADRFIVLGYTGSAITIEAISGQVKLPLYVGPDPSGDPSTTIHADGPDLFMPDELKWLVDFDAAVSAGMGLKINISAAQAESGFTRILVLGLQLSSSDADAQSALEQILQHHHNGRSGLSLVPQGTPTHNTAGKGTGYTQLDNADQSFDDRKNAPLFNLTTDPLAKRDGQWIAELLGVDPAIFETVHGSNGDDQMQARAMQCALWPATLGYWMDKMLTPIFGDETVDNARWFFTNYVSGRGQVPAVRIGGQPYGILPTTAFSRIQWLNERPGIALLNNPPKFLGQLYSVLSKIDVDWTGLSQNVATIGKSDFGKSPDAHQILLDIIGLHPASVEFYSRYAESLPELYNLINLWGIGPDFWKAWLALSLDAGAVGLLAKLGYSGPKPDILNHVFMSDAALIPTVIDDRPLSETDQIRAYTGDNRNYIQWLIDAAKISLDAIYQEQGFKDNKTPEALLYLYLRHALMLGYYDSSYFLHRAAGFLSVTELQAMKPEPNFVHVAESSSASESRFAALYKTESRITASPSLLVSDYITRNIGLISETFYLNDQLRCLQTLAGASTASLERTFAEHIDCCTYRYDAWLLGIVHYQLQAMRSLSGAEGEKPRRGIYLGAYGWIENLKPSATQLNPVQLPDDLAKQFPGENPILSDSANAGYIHAPSMAHAETSAVLRSGYSANASNQNPDTLAVNLSSDRVRAALTILEGIRNGQSFGALLGYQFERGLHDDFGLVEVDKFIYPLRKAFPLASDTISTTKTPPDVSIEAIEARNVMDGYKLVKQIRATNNHVYPFGADQPPISAILPGANNDEAKAINDQAAALLDIYDAIADLALAEGVHQAVQGNFERIAATLDAYTTGTFPPEPEVIQTPPSGIGLTHRVGIHFKPGLVVAANATPKATVEPALNDWLATTLPSLDKIQCKVIWKDPLDGSDESEKVTLDKLEVAPIDLFGLIKPDQVQSMTELDDRILSYVLAQRKPRPDATLSIQYMTSDATHISVFATLPLLRSLKQVVTRSRPLRATDAMLHNQASPEDDDSVFINSSRFAAPLAQLNKIDSDITTFLGTLNPLLADTVTNRTAILADIDSFLDSTVALLERASRFNIGNSGWGFAHDWKHQAFLDLMSKISDLVTRWKAKLTAFDAQITAYDLLPLATSDAERFALLKAAELQIVATLVPPPPLPLTLRNDLNAMRATFLARMNQFVALLNTNDRSFSNLLAKTKAINTADLDPVPFDVTPFEERAIVLSQDLAANLTGHRKEIQDRAAATQRHLTDAQSAATARDQVAAMLEAAKSLLGPDFQVFPEFSISSDQGDEWANSLAAYTSGSLTKYLTTTAKLDFPVDEWLYGVARIRPNMRSWEQVLSLTSAFKQPVPELIPAQFPFEATAPWLALQYPSTYSLISDHVLYTAYYPVAFDKTTRQCGILLDEWTEVVPATDRVTGITFNFDRPNNEAPQSLLLVTPASATGEWTWEDLVGGVNETLDLAKKRLVEPGQIDFTPYSCLLPATIMAVTFYGISITTSLAAANGVFRSLESTHA
jgi:hypothetical protein